MQQKKYGEMSLLEFQDRFGTEEACQQYLIQMRFPEGFQCPHCKSKRHCFKPGRQEFSCYDCNKVTSPTAGTVFHQSHVPLRKWFWCIYLLSTPKKAVSTLYLAQQLMVNYKTAWSMRRKIQKAMAHRDDQYRLEGPVEVDEIWIGGKQTFKKRREIGPNKTPFFLAVSEDTIGAPRFAKASELETGYQAQEIEEATQVAVPDPSSSILKGDAHGAHQNMANHGYTLEISKQSKNPEVTAEHLKWVNIVTSNLKRYLISTHHGVFGTYRKEYIAEFLYRFNRRFWPRQAFARLLFANIFKGPTPLRIAGG